MSGLGSGGGILGQCAPMIPRPLLDGLASPHLAHVEHVIGPGEVLACGDLLSALSGNAEHRGYLIGADEAAGKDHDTNRTLRLTTWHLTSSVVHVSSWPGGGSLPSPGTTGEPLDATPGG